MVNQSIIIKAESDFEREKLRFPFGLKGAYISELWQTIVLLEDDKGEQGLGLATQSVLYGDAEIFAATSESSGNAYMFVLTNKALKWIEGKSFHTPIELFDEMLLWLLEEGRKLTGHHNLNINFVYNALVSIDNAMWMLYAKENGISTFRELIPSIYRPTFSYKNDRIAVMFQVSYDMALSEVQKAADQGYFVFKIKTGSPGDQDSMLRKDKARLKEIHDILDRKRNNEISKIYYTMDANGRYGKKETLRAYLDYAKKIGAFEHILLYEEPFMEGNDEDVSDLGLIVGADESIHNENDARRKMALGYKAFILKGIAKTLSQTIKIATVAHENGIPCLCSDLTVNPILVDWNKNLAATLAPFPIIGMGLMETNGDMNYANWENMKERHPFADANWTQVTDGIFQLDQDFYAVAGGIFSISSYYREMMEGAEYINYVKTEFSDGKQVDQNDIKQKR
ncbi:enolase C-terminal domain-like protein [Sphingobacterium haloxyli]|uniref:L-alanine-DL-glutamate epimerase n=1 Tax=Sphingobacterium haloxyli TaxID=2100533 RepID=A0A2S9J5V4_9SPHI|nr:enolase C-terminal domain-like protein [Sphingobacterium haloxyli]PRD48119.1 L-alanine-DL-glutamate epimerase [Sphingobacterium haloxyli]